MTKFENLMAMLFRDFQFYTGDSDGDEDSDGRLEIEEVVSGNGLAPAIHIITAQYLVRMGLSKNIVDATNRLGLKFRPEKYSFLGTSVVRVGAEVPDAFELLLIETAIMNRPGLGVEETVPVPNQKINIAYLFASGRSLIAELSAHPEYVGDLRPVTIISEPGHEA